MARAAWFTAVALVAAVFRWLVAAPPPPPPRRLVPVRVRAMGGPTDDRARGIAVSPGGDVYLATTVGGRTTVSRFSAAGLKMWSSPLDSGVHSYGFLLAPADDGGALVAGDGFLRRLGPRGEVLWSTPADDVSGMAAGSEGQSVVATHRYRQCGPARCGEDYLRAYGPDGRATWELRLPNPAAPYGVADVTYTPEGTLLAVGNGDVLELTADHVTRVESFQHGSASLLRVAVSRANGDVVLAGTLPPGEARFGGLTLSNPDEQHRAFVLALNRARQPRWGRVLPSSVVSNLAVDARGNIVVGGSILGGCPRAKLFQLDAYGALQAELPLPDTTCDDEPLASATLPPAAALAFRDGTLLVTGSFTGPFHAGVAQARADHQDVFWLDLQQL